MKPRHALGYVALLLGVALSVDGANLRAQQSQSLVDALVKGSIAEVAQANLVGDPVLRFQTEVVRVAVPAAQSLGVRFRDDGARSLLTYLGSDPIAGMVRDPGPPGVAPLPAQRSANQKRFVGLLLAHADHDRLEITVESVRKTQDAITAIRPAGWFCPCWPFCK